MESCNNACAGVPSGLGVYILTTLLLMITIYFVIRRYPNKKPYQFIRRRCDFGWDSLARVGNSNFAKLTVLMPILGYFILFNDYIRCNFNVFGCFPIWKVFLLYFGLLFMSVASLIFAVWCPKIIRIYENPREYITHALDFTISLRLEDLIRKVYAPHKAVHEKGAVLVSKKEIPTMVTFLIGSMRASEDEDNGVARFASEIEAMELEWANNPLDRNTLPLRPRFHDLKEGQREEMGNSKYRKYPTIKELLYAHYMMSIDESYAAREVVSRFYLIGGLLISIPTLFMIIEVICKVAMM